MNENIEEKTPLSFSIEKVFTSMSTDKKACRHVHKEYFEADTRIFPDLFISTEKRTSV